MRIIISGQYFLSLILTETHGPVGTLSDGEDMRGDLVPPLATVETHRPHGVDGEPLVGVHGDTEETGVGVDEPLNVPLLQIEEDRGVIEIGEVRHVLTAVVLGRVHLQTSRIDSAPSPGWTIC